MWVRYNETDKYWEKSTDNVNFSPLEENLAFDGDTKFGSNVSADIDGYAATRHFTFDGNTKTVGQISVGATAAGTANVVGSFAVHNRGVAGAEKRIGAVVAATDGAQNSGHVEFWTANAGTFTSKGNVNRLGDWSLGLPGLADIFGGTSFRYVTADGGTIPAWINIGSDGAINTIPGRLIFFNRGKSGNDKRIAEIQAFADGALNSGMLIFSVWEAGVARELLRLVKNSSILIGLASAIATTATDGFPYFRSGAGAPTGVPSAITGMVPMYIDTTNSKIWFRIGGAWKGVVVA